MSEPGTTHGGATTPIAPLTASITVVGLGPGALDQLSLGAVRVLEEAEVVYARTRRHPTIDALQTPEGRALVGDLRWESFDDLYDRETSFAGVYAAIVERLLQQARADGHVVFAVPGHPLVAERTVQVLRGRAAAEGAVVEIVGSASCVEAVCAAVGADIAAGLQVADALALDDDLSQPAFPAPWAPLLILQVYSRAVASDVKLALLRHYPPEHPVQLVQHAGMPDRQHVFACALSDIDRNDLPDHLSSLWVPPVPALQPRSSLRTLEAICARLRAPDGCPWDREQSHHSIKRNLLEETYELLEALDAEDAAAQTEELGDLLFQVFLHAQMGKEAGEYDLGDVTAALTDKLVRRHPHVFGDVAVSGAEEVLRNWDAIKKAEGAGKQSVLEGLPAALSALTMALALTRRAATSGFTWPDVDGAWAKFEEELGELRAAGSDAERRYELGDVLFTLVNVGRLLGYDPEECLRAANRRFRERFMAMERLAAARRLDLRAEPLERLLRLWRETADAGTP
jgi:tetrapyrrole methylase family protein / MazG family protein